jgi:hypothetical protein
MVEENLKSNVACDEVLLITDENLIQGKLWRRNAICGGQTTRFSDALDSPSDPKSQYVDLTEATVTRIATGEQLLSSAFLMVARSKIVAAVPLSELSSCAFDSVGVAGEIAGRVG